MLSNFSMRACCAFTVVLAASILPNFAHALLLGPGDLAISDCGGNAACIDVTGNGAIALAATGTTNADIELDFGGRVILGDPGFGPPPFPGFPPPANPWTVTVSYETTGNNPGITWPLNDGDLRFTDLDGGAADVDVLASNIGFQAVVLSAGVLTHTFDVSQAQSGLAPGIGFGDFHLFDVQFDLGDNAALSLTRIQISPASTVQPPIGMPEPGTLALLGVALAAIRLRRR